LVEQCIGAGEIAISDHRGSQPDLIVLSDAASDCRVGGILAGKAGVMYCHIGTGQTLLEPLRDVIRQTQIPIQTFLPTHMERSEALIEDGAKWVKEGRSLHGHTSPPPPSSSFLSLSLSLSLSCPISLSLPSNLSLTRHHLSGGYVDFTCRSLKARLALKTFLKEGVPLERVMVSSDSYGSLPTFDEDGWVKGWS